jgi:hypothetical protein
MRELQNERLDNLVEVFADYADQLADLLADEAVATSRQDREEIYLAIARLLAQLRLFARRWADETLAETFADADADAMQMLSKLGLLSDDSFGEKQQDEIFGLVTFFTAEVRNAAVSVQALAARVLQQQGLTDFGLTTSERNSLVGGLLTGAALSLLRARLRKAFRDAAVSVVGKDSKLYRYSLDYYAALAAQKANFEAASAAAVLRSKSNGYDLVRVSPNPSTIGDYCDAYRGRVFSISGEHPTYPPVSSLPGGGCPMHANCHHTLQVFDGNDAFGPLAEEFAQMGAGQYEEGFGVNDFQSLWASRLRSKD